jgi:hypothetical protein
MQTTGFFAAANLMYLIIIIIVNALMLTANAEPANSDRVTGLQQQ